MKFHKLALIAKIRNYMKNQTKKIIRKLLTELIIYYKNMVDLIFFLLFIIKG